jgi:putative FmdB family regulatory protein
MPIYEYSCNACGVRQSRFFRSFNSVTDVVQCESCGSEDTIRLYSTTFAVTMAMSRVDRELANSPASALDPENQ